jgi:hypothetical protein
MLTHGECFEALAACRGVRIERILSSDQPEPVLYDQEPDEWVCLLPAIARNRSAFASETLMCEPGHQALSRACWRRSASSSASWMSLRRLSRSTV